MYPSLHIHTHILMCSIQNTYYINIFVDIIENREECILSDDCHITSEMFNYDGGELLIKEHSVKITVPIGAIEEGYKVQIEAAASLFGPYVIPDGYYPISAYVWIGTCSKFIKKPLKVEIEHDIVSDEINSSELCILTASEKDICGEKAGQKIFKMNKDTVKYQIQISDTTCTVLSDHFCSKCLAMIANQKPKPARIMMYHYLPENYQDKKDFQAEVSFCPDHTFYKQVRNQLIFLAEYE